MNYTLNFPCATGFYVIAQPRQIPYLFFYLGFVHFDTISGLERSLFIMCPLSRLERTPTPPDLCTTSFLHGPTQKNWGDRKRWRPWPNFTWNKNGSAGCGRSPLKSLWQGTHLPFPFLFHSQVPLQKSMRTKGLGTLAKCLSLFSRKAKFLQCPFYNFFINANTYRFHLLRFYKVKRERVSFHSCI